MKILKNIGVWLLIFASQLAFVDCLGAYGEALVPASEVQRFVLPGAFGEAFDDLDDETKAHCIAFADRALEQMRDDYAEAAMEDQFDFYLQVLQTTVFLLEEEQPASATDAEKTIWTKYYRDVVSIVSFVAIDNYLGMGGGPIGEPTGRYGSYAIMKDGTIELFSLSRIRALIFADPIVEGMRTINLGSYYNAVYAMENE